MFSFCKFYIIWYDISLLSHQLKIGLIYLLYHLFSTVKKELTILFFIELGVRFEGKV